MSSFSNDELANNRAALRDLHRKLDDNRQNYTSTSNTGLSEVQQEANDRFGKSMQESRGAALDAKLLNKVSVLGAEQAGNLAKKGETFVRTLQNKFGQTHGGGSSSADSIKLDWLKLCRQLHEYGVYAHVPAVTFLLGEFEAPVAKVRQQRKAKDRTSSEPMQTADTVSVSQLREVQEEKAQNARIKQVYDTIERNGGRVNIFHLLLNPRSFSQTVENFFDLGFLVKDGRVSIEAGADCAFVSIAKPPETAEFDRGLVKQQNILKLDHATYTKLAERWCGAPGLPLLPDRDKRSQADLDKAADPEGSQPTQPVVSQVTQPASKKRKQ